MSTTLSESALVAAAGSTGVVVVAVPDEPDSFAVPGGLPAEELHVTIGYYGDTSEVDEAVVAALTAFIGTTGDWSTSASVGGMARMGDDDPQAVTLLVESSDLQDVRNRLVDVAVPNMLHPHYTPHVTLGFGIEFPDDPPRSIDFSKLELWVGPDRISAAQASSATMARQDPPADSPSRGEQFDGTADDVEMPPDVRKAAEARVAAAVKKYGGKYTDGA